VVERSNNAAWAQVLSQPGVIAPSMDLFCVLSHKTQRNDRDLGFLSKGAAWMLALDRRGLADLVNRFSEWRAEMAVDLTRHFSPLLDGVLEEQLQRPEDVFETALQFLERRDDPHRALAIAEAFLARGWRRIGDDAWSPSRRPPWNWTAERRLRIGYVCAELTIHPVGLSIRTLLLRHDKARFELFVYDCTPKPDRIVAGPVALGADVLRPCLGMSSHELCQLVRDDGIDILVDLSGAALGSGDTVFSRCAAPVRVGMIGYPGAMGRDTVDFTVVDPGTVLGSERAGFSERLIVMPGSFLPHDDTFTVGAELPSRHDLGLPEDGFVMVAFNRLNKLNVETLQLWAGCLKRLPQAVLWLSTDDTAAAANLAVLFERIGLPAEQLVVSAKLGILPHARRLARADISLDPLGYNGGYGTALSLRCGVPVICRPGQCFAWRMSAGLLHQAGLGDCVVASPRHYFELVAKIAEEPAYAQKLRDRLAAATGAGVFDTRRYAAGLEAAFLEIAAQYQQNMGRQEIDQQGAVNRDIDVAQLLS